MSNIINNIKDKKHEYHNGQQLSNYTPDDFMIEIRCLMLNRQVPHHMKNNKQSNYNLVDDITKNIKNKYNISISKLRKYQNETPRYKVSHWGALFDAFLDIYTSKTTQEKNTLFVPIENNIRFNLLIQDAKKLVSLIYRKEALEFPYIVKTDLEPDDYDLYEKKSNCPYGVLPERSSIKSYFISDEQLATVLKLQRIFREITNLCKITPETMYKSADSFEKMCTNKNYSYLTKKIRAKKVVISAETNAHTK